MLATGPRVLNSVPPILFRMDHARFCRWVVFRGVPGINNVIIGVVPALRPRCAKTPPWDMQAHVLWVMGTPQVLSRVKSMFFGPATEGDWEAPNGPHNPFCIRRDHEHRMDLVCITSSGWEREVAQTGLRDLR